MKFAIALIFISTLSIAKGQKLVDQFSYSSTFCSGTYYLFSDSSFVYELGCEEHSSITIGAYTKTKDSIFFYPKKLSEIDLVLKVEYFNTDSSSQFTTTYSTIADSTVKADAKYQSKEIAERWLAGKIDTDSLFDHMSIVFDSGSWRFVRTSDETLYSCPIELQRLLNKKLIFPLPPEINEIRIYLALPYTILKQMFNYEMVYEDMPPGRSTVGKRKTRTIYR